MSCITPLEMNMSISQNIYEGYSDNRLVDLAQKVAIYAIIPLALVVMFEAIVKNLICINLANAVITIINLSYDRYHACLGN
jgi:hypothetical protein